MVMYDVSMKFTRRCLFAVFVLLPVVWLKAQVTSNVFERVLNVRVNLDADHNETATAFTVDVDGKEYLITAKHVVKHLKDDGTIYVYMNHGWSAIHVKIFRCEDPIDIAVLVPPRQLTVNFELPFEKTNFFYGQDAYFLGFPYGIRTDATGANGPYPLAVIKRGTISGTVVLDKTKKATVVLLDGYKYVESATSRSL